MASGPLSFFKFSHSAAACLIVSAATFGATAGFTRAQAGDSILFSFNAATAVGQSPAADLVFDSIGNLYGTTTAEGSNPNGVVFQLTPKRVETVLHSFGGPPNDGSDPHAGLIFDTKGALYGTTLLGGTNGCGTVFQLTPPIPPSKTWGYAILYNFKGAFSNDGCRPDGDLILDSKGALYGTTGGGGTNGTVFKLAPPVPPAKTWTETVLYFFNGGNDGSTPLGRLTFDTSGALYGTTQLGGPSNLGTVFKLTLPVPPAKKWTEAVLYSFAGGSSDGAQPVAGLAIDSAGVLYGTTLNGGSASGYGTVFALTPPVPPATKWTEAVLHSFKGKGDGAYPAAGLTFNSTGKLLYGTTGGGLFSGSNGTVFKLTRPAPPATKWTETVLHSFKLGLTDGNTPLAGVILDSKGALYGTTEFGGKFNWGTVFKD